MTEIGEIRGGSWQILTPIGYRSVLSTVSANQE
jgi:hypothetical protein